MRIVLIADSYPPLRSSSAVQLRDLSQEFVKHGHHITVIIPSADLKQPWLLEDVHGVQVMRLRAPTTKNIGYLRRTINEFLLPFFMLHNLRKSPLANESWDGIVWYSPSIFLGPVANALKQSSKCRSYLILRDIFPEWAVDMGLMGRGMTFRFFKTIENYQYSVASVIGVQTTANLSYFDSKVLKGKQKIEVLQNWLTMVPNVGCSISIAKSTLEGRKIFVYAGNMGVAQGMDILIALAERLIGRKDIGFVFVGRGSEAKRLQEYCRAQALDNVLFFDEIEPSEIPGLYSQCHVGMVALDPRHKTHNIPGKFLSYMQSGLPVLASINPGNDLELLIKSEGVGRVCTDNSPNTLLQLAEELVQSIDENTNNSARCKKLSEKLFSSEAAVKQILAGLARTM